MSKVESIIRLSPLGMPPDLHHVDKLLDAALGGSTFSATVLR